MSETQTQPGGSPAESTPQPTVPPRQTAYVRPYRDGRARLGDAGSDRYPIETTEGDSGGTLWEGALAVSYGEGTRWDGRNHVSLATGSQWDHERLVQTRRGRYYLTHDSQWQGSRPYATPVTVPEAARWLARNEYGPDDPDMMQYSPALAAALREALEDA